MSAIEQKLLERIRRLDDEQQKQVLDFVQRLAQSKGEASSAEDWEHQPWTDDEIRDMLTPKRKSFKEVADWLEANPPTEPWGDLRDDEDAAEYVHRMRRKGWDDEGYSQESS
jgi:hypothetical protein